MSRDFERLRTCEAGFECNVDKVNQNSRTAVVLKLPLNLPMEKVQFLGVYWTLLIIF